MKVEKSILTEYEAKDFQRSRPQHASAIVTDYGFIRYLEGFGDDAKKAVLEAVVKDCFKDGSGFTRLSIYTERKNIKVLEAVGFKEVVKSNAVSEYDPSKCLMEIFSGCHPCS